MDIKARKLEESRIRTVYSQRDLTGKRLLYRWHREEVLFNIYRFRTVVASMLARSAYLDLSEIEALDVGCGTGSWLRTLVEWGASPEHLHGIDLLQERIDSARSIIPQIDFQLASGYDIPFPNDSMDLISAHTVFSSILNADARRALAQEMNRVLTDSGIVLIYDYRVSDPRNPDTIGIRRAEIQRLFPGFNLQFRSLTLAPPLARRLAPFSPLLAHMMEVWLPFLRTHAIYLLRQHI